MKRVIKLFVLMVLVYAKKLSHKRVSYIEEPYNGNFQVWFYERHFVSLSFINKDR